MHNSLQELNHRITLERAKEMTRLFRENKDNILKPEFLGQDILPISETLNRTAMDQLLAQPSCVGVRIYYSMDETLKIHAILVGVNDQGQDILPADSSSISTEEEEGVILEEMQRCPPNCPSSELNP